VFNLKVIGQIYLNSEDIYDEAQSFIDAEEYVEALPLLIMLEKKGVKNANICYNIGLCYLNHDGPKSRAIPYLEESSGLMSENYSGVFSDSCAPLKSLLLLGIAYRINNQIDKAKETFSRLIENSVDTGLIKTAEFNIRRCKVAEIMSKYPLKASIISIEDSSEYSVYNPVVFRAEKERVYYMQKLKFYDAILSSSIDKTNIADPENLTPLVGSDGDLILVSASVDGQTLLLCDYVSGEGYELFYTTKLNDGNWQKFTRFSKPVNSQYNETGACLSADGKTLYFSSNRLGGFGASDIYKTEKLGDNQWSEPVNIGTTVNTAFNEISPYLSADGNTLYFCSEGHLNMGGYDFFVSTKNNEGNWSLPVNPGVPVSTTDNDVYICPGNEINTLFTYRIQPGKDDRSKIYKINLTEGLPGYKLLLTGELAFTDSIPPKQVVYNIVDNKNQNTVDVLQTDAEGKYATFLTPGDFTLNFIYDENTSAKQRLTVNPDNRIEELNIDSPEWQVMRDEPEFVLLIRDILYDFDSYILKTDYYPMLDSIASILNRFKDIRIELMGHTDSKGSSLYNLRLSEKRALAVKNYLVLKGVKADRITIAGKGKEIPVARNTNSDGSDNAQGRKYNRRVTLEIRFAGEKIRVLKSKQIPIELEVR
jgi:outer membrane protein OmpA-like peptidoglycan-associated protein/tetratricopeptide (TPR) repeat protein